MPRKKWQRRKAQLVVRLTIGERRLLNEAAQQDYLTVSKWTRLALQHALLRRRRRLPQELVTAVMGA